MSYEMLVVAAFYALCMRVASATADRSTPVWSKIPKGGNKFLKILVSNTKDNVSGYTKADLVRVKPHQNCMLSARVEANDTEGTYRPSVRDVEINANKKRPRKADFAFSKGMDNWIWEQVTFWTAISSAGAYGGAHEL